MNTGDNVTFVGTGIKLPVNELPKVGRTKGLARIWWQDNGGLSCCLVSCYSGKVSVAICLAELMGLIVDKG